VKPDLKRKHKGEKKKHRHKKKRLKADSTATEVSLMCCVCGSTEWDHTILMCDHCGKGSHGVCYGIIFPIPGLKHTCGQCSAQFDIPCTDEGVKLFYTTQDISETEQVQIKEDFLFKKASVAYLRDDYSGFLGTVPPKTDFSGSSSTFRNHKLCKF